MKIGIDLSDVEVSESGFKSLPAGRYPATIIDSDYKATKSGEGMCLHLVFAITEGEYAGRQLRDFLTLEHTNEQTVNIAKAKLKELAVAAGHKNPDRVEDTDELHGPLTVVVTRKEDKDWGDDDGFVNRIQRYMAKDASSDVKASAPF